jgi:hypothetical protein
MMKAFILSKPNSPLMEEDWQPEDLDGWQSIS